MPARKPSEISLDLPLTDLPGALSRQRTALALLGLQTVRDLVFHFPFRHEDFTRTSNISEAQPGEHITIVAQVTGVDTRRSFHRRGLTVTEASLHDGTGRLKAIWFNQPYLAKTLHAGTTYRFAGKITQTKYGPTLSNPLYELADKEVSAYAAPLVPVYALTAGISQHVLRRMLTSLRPLMNATTDPLPLELRNQYHLAPLGAALIGIHFPTSLEELRRARRRLAFDEMFRLQLIVSRLRRFRADRQAVSVKFDETATKRFVAKLPYKLTNDQRRAAWEILLDMTKTTPMHRLLDGDVGSGKTVVAAIAALNAARGGYQTAIMAPTEILAKQHFDSLAKLFAVEKMPLALWTNSYKRLFEQGSVTEFKGVKAKALGARIAAGEIPLIVGTHSLAEESLSFDRLALAIIDEQHRFGVGVRQTLCAKSGISNTEPHLLSMTATPIPRSLALTFYGDLDLSIIKEKPLNRKRIVTRIAGPKERADAFSAIRRELAAGHQVFYVCPLIDPSDVLGVASVTESAERLQAGPLAGVPLAVLHGKLKAEEKEKIMNDFLANRLKVLVATSVIEVGVDIPNATVMAIEGAERFGMAQLHQLRGRVGRGADQSYCWLLPTNLAPAAVTRLRAVVEAADGFVLAEKDLALRGPGDLLGKEQSGWPPMRIAALGDAELIRDTREAAQGVLDKDPDLKAPEWQNYLPERDREAHLE